MKKQKARAAMILSVIGAVITVAAINARSSEPSACDECDNAAGSHGTYAECYNRLNKPWVALYFEGDKKTAEDYVKKYGKKFNSGSIDQAQLYYPSYKTCDVLPNGRKAIYVGKMPLVTQRPTHF